MAMPESNSIVPKSLGDSGETPEDIATLYSWANLHGAKYRDFSASRAEAREEARLRVEKAQAEERRRQEEEAERKRQEEAQIAARLAAEAAEAARQAEAERLAEIARQAEAERQAVLSAQEAQRQAAWQRASQPAPVAEERIDYPAKEWRDADGAPASAWEPYGDERRSVGQAEVYELHEPGEEYPSAQPRLPLYLQTEAASQYRSHFAEGLADDRTTDRPAERSAKATFKAGFHPSYAEPFHAAGESFAEFGEVRYPEGSYSVAQSDSFGASLWQAQESREMTTRPAWLTVEPAAAPSAPPPRIDAAAAQAPRGGAAARPAWSGAGSAPPLDAGPSGQAAQAAALPARPAQSQFLQQPSSPLQPSGSGLKPGPMPEQPARLVDDTLLGSRDRVVHRWYALKSVFEPQSPQVEPQAAAANARVPVLAVFSLAGGVGKTSLVASLGRALSARGERVLLVDMAAYGLLPFFFGARDQRPGMLRTFNPPGAGADAPIQLVTLDPEGQAPEPQGLEPNLTPGQEHNTAQSGSTDWLGQEVGRYARGSNRVLIDLPTASGSTTRRVLRMGPAVLVPVAPDMNSVVSVGAIEAFFRNSSGAQGRHILPFYVLNQFDASLPLHLDVREILREQIGDRLLPFALRRSAAVSEALAEGMTVMDYAPNAVVAEDYINLAAWVRSLSAPAAQGYRGVRWSER